MAVAVVGCGRWGRNHIRNYAEIGALAAVVDRKPEAARAEGEAHGVPALTLDEALARDDIAGIALALPPAANLPVGRRVLEAGKHLFVEKPLGLTVEDAEELSALGERLGRPVMVGHILRYHPAFVALERLVTEGALGRLLSVTSTRLDLGRIRREEDALWALAPHDLSMVLALLGPEPARVEASAGFHTHPSISDEATLTLDYAGGARAEIRASWLNPYKEQRLTVVGTRAMAVFDDREPWERKLVLHPYELTEAEGGGEPDLRRGEPIAVQVTHGEPLRLECRHFLQCIASGTRPTTDGQEALRVLRVLDKASETIRTNRTRQMKA